MQRQTILLVEDDIALLEGMSDTLEMVGYKTIQATNGQEGLDALKRAQPDLIISDIMMPEMDGYLFHKEVISHPENAAIPFIFLTAKSDQADVRKGLREGVDAYLTKPFDLEDLLLHVQNKLNRFATIRKQSLAQLEELQRQIVTMFSHELRTPLTYIQGYTDLLADTPQPANAEEIELFLRGLQTGSKRLSKLVENLLCLVQLDTDLYSQEFAEYSIVESDIGRIARLPAGAHASMAADKGITIHVDIADSLPAVRLVEDQIIQALSRLIENAIKFTRAPDAKVRLHVYQSGNRVCMDVIDQGIGIAPNHIPHIFERFRQIDRERHEQAGIGVGLSIARGLAQTHGGDIEAESTLGEGSKFTLWLPALDGA